MIEDLPAEIHGASVTAGAARTVVDEPLVDLAWTEPDAEISASRTQAACRMTGGGRFWVEDGTRVVVEAHHDQRPIPWLHATISALVLAQQGRFALHANVVDVNGTVLAIAGQRRAGKSTTSLALRQRGHRLITDDVAALDIDGEQVIHRPAGRPIHIHPPAAVRLGVSIDGAIPVAGNPEKLALPNPASPPVAMNAIVLLRTADRGDVRLARLGTAQSTRVVHLNAYRRGFLDRIWKPEVFQWAGGVASRVPVWVLVRPAEEWTIDAVCATLECVARDVGR